MAKRERKSPSGKVFSITRDCIVKNQFGVDIPAFDTRIIGPLELLPLFPEAKPGMVATYSVYGDPAFFVPEGILMGQVTFNTANNLMGIMVANVTAAPITFPVNGVKITFTLFY